MAADDDESRAALGSALHQSQIIKANVNRIVVIGRPKWMRTAIIPRPSGVVDDRIYYRIARFHNIEIELFMEELYSEVLSPGSDCKDRD